MTKETHKRHPEHEHLTDDVPTYLRLDPPTLTSDMSSKAPASGLSRSISHESNNHEDNTEHFTPDPPLESAPSASRYVTSILDKEMKPERPYEKVLWEMSTSEQQSVALISEIFQHTLSSQDTECFSVSTPDTFDGSSLEKLEMFEAQCRSVFLSNKRKYSDPTRQAVFAGSYLEGTAFEWWKNELRKPTNEFKQSAHHFWDELQTHF